MNVPFQCGKCGKQLSAKAELAGRRVKCPQCGEAVAVPGAAPVAAAGSPAPQPHPAEYGMPPGPGTASLADLLDDSGPGKLVEAPLLQYGQMFCPNCQQPIAVNSAICVKCGADLRGGKGLVTKHKGPASEGQKRFLAALAAFGWAILIQIVAGVLFGGFLALWFGLNLIQYDAVPWRAISISILVMAGGFAILNYVSLLADAFQEGWLHGLLFLLLPFYNLFYIVTRWQNTWRTYLWFIVAYAFCLVGGVMLVSVRQWEADHPEPTEFKFSSRPLEQESAAVDPFAGGRA